MYNSTNQTIIQSVSRFCYVIVQLFFLELSPNLLANKSWNNTLASGFPCIEMQFGNPHNPISICIRISHNQNIYIDWRSGSFSRRRDTDVDLPFLQYPVRVTYTKQQAGFVDHHARPHSVFLQEAIYLGHLQRTNLL